MNLRQLNYLIRVVEAGNITRAAELLHVAQPALGMQIRQLETELGVELLIRHSRGVAASEAGRLLVERAREILGLVESARYDVAALAGKTREYLSVGLTPSVMSVMSPDLIVKAKECIPDLSVSFTENLSYALVDAVEKGELDLALAFDADERTGLDYIHLLSEELLFVVAPDQATAEGHISAEDLLGWPLILTGPRDSVRRTLEIAAQAIGMTPDIVFEVQSVAAIKRLVALGLGAAILPPAVIREELQQGKLVARHIVDPPLMRNLHLVKAIAQPQRHHEAALVALMRNMLANTLQATPGLSHVA
ncbi:LysR family transcriptional regulator [Paraburkholderia sprentiae WSM5005]|uniref:LysR family transcriptional regulator n=1 Tax=Paraburkholderia sprentiae WSM5005 TaxID=754502 RepID=A0A1I9YKS7_9BURK|nr:LysR substrate-binding domain-containing protein [Paraburkholderia sprentiae]APA86910.2 LysR family transcriptional regulator [Paraburkholderia sprentiae WSM5005]